MQTSAADGLHAPAAARFTGSAHVVGVDHDARLVVGEVIVELVGEAHVHQRGDRADAPAGEQAEQIVHAVVGEDA